MKKVLFLVTLFLMPSSFAYTGIEIANRLAEDGLIQPQEQSERYRLYDNLTRQEAVGIALIELGVELPENYTCQGYFDDLTDTAPNNWACRAFEVAADIGLVSRENNRARPEDIITEVESLALLTYGMTSAPQPTNWNRLVYYRVSWRDAVLWKAYYNQIIYADGLSVFGPVLNQKNTIHRGKFLRILFRKRYGNFKIHTDYENYAYKNDIIYNLGTYGRGILVDGSPSSGSRFTSYWRDQNSWVQIGHIKDTILIDGDAFIHDKDLYDRWYGFYDSVYGVENRQKGKVTRLHNGFHKDDVFIYPHRIEHEGNDITFFDGDNHFLVGDKLYHKNGELLDDSGLELFETGVSGILANKKSFFIDTTSTPIPDGRNYGVRLGKIDRGSRQDPAYGVIGATFMLDESMIESLHPELQPISCTPKLSPLIEDSNEEIFVYLVLLNCD